MCGKLQGLAEFRQGRERLAKGQYQLAELELKRALQILDNSRETDTSSFALLMTDIALAQAAQEKNSQAEQTLERLVQRGKEGELGWTAMGNLLAFYLGTAPNKAVQLANQAVLDASLSTERRQEARFVAGTGILLQQEDLGKAISLLTPAFPSYLQPFAWHNLGCAQWWAVAPLTSPTKPSSDSLLPAITSLTECIKAFESVSELTEALPLLSPYTGLSLTTLAAVYLAVGKEAQASKWLKVALKSYQKHAPGQTSRPLVLLASLLRREKAFLHAEGMLQFSIDQLSKSKPSPDLVSALKEYALTLQSNPKRLQESQNLLSQAKTIESKLTPWANLAAYLHLPSLQPL